MEQLGFGYKGGLMPLADGQTGSGKTFTMYGKRDDPNLWGIAPRAMKEIFTITERDSGDGS